MWISLTIYSVALSVSKVSRRIGVVPVLGWWDQRRGLKIQEMSFSLVVSVFGPGVYAAIKPRVRRGWRFPTIEINRESSYRRA